VRGGVRRELLKSKIHRARVTGKSLHYEGSLTLDPELMEAAGLVPYEKVHVLNVNTGARFEKPELESFQPKVVHVDERNRPLPHPEHAKPSDLPVA